ncbi:MAG: outer membrane porin GjpA, partial [Mycobacterium sp.]
MHQTLRPYVTAGVAVLGAGMIAATPLAAASAVDVHSMPDVALTAGIELGDIDFTKAWTDAFNTATSNYDTVTAALHDAQSALSDALAAKPDVDGQQLFDAVTFLGGDQKGFLNPLSNWTLDGAHSLLYYGLTGQLAATGLFPAPDETVQGVVNFLASPLSGTIFSQLGPSISPLVSMINSFDAISGDLTGSAPNYTAALQEMVNIPANMLNGFLNGDTLNLDTLIPAIVKADLIALPDGASIDHLNLAFGGLLTPGGVPGAGADGVTAAGGSIFNALGLDLSGVPIINNLAVAADGVGPLGAMAGFEQALAALFSGSLNWAGDTTTTGGAEFTDGLTGLLDGLGL